MRVLTVALALVVATVTLTTQIAAACGGTYGARPRPSVLVVTSHSIPTPRSFAILGALDADVADWQHLAPRTFDPTSIASLGTLDVPMTLTLVGPERARVVTATQQVGLANLFFSHTSSKVRAVEIPRAKGDDVVVALRGRVPGARLVLPEYRMDGTVVLVEDLTAVHRASGNDRAFDLHRGTQFLGTHEGSVVGILTVDGAQYVVAERDGRATTIAL